MPIHQEVTFSASPERIYELLTDSDKFAAATGRAATIGDEGTAMLLDHPLGGTPPTYALAPLMCFDAARLPARVDESGNLHSLFPQHRTQWDQELVAEGLKLLELSATGSQLTEYHVEAAIAAVHARALQPEDTDWNTIVSLYNTLIALRRELELRSGRRRRRNTSRRRLLWRASRPTAGSSISASPPL